MPEIPEYDVVADVLAENLAPPVKSQEYAILQTFKSLHNDNMRHVALIDQVEYEAFPLLAFLKHHNIEVDIASKPRQELVTWMPCGNDGEDVNAPPWRPLETIKTGSGRLTSKLGAGIVRFNYKETDFVVYKISWHPQAFYEYGQRALYDIVFEGPYDEWCDLTSAGHALASDVYRWAGSLKNEIWVYQHGNWSKNKPLWWSIQRSSWDSICLDPEFVQAIRRDVRAFFDSEEIYHGLGIVWKRGILMVGPPGNGKTETIKIILKEMGQTALYVKSFKTDRMYCGPEIGIREIFDHARANSPCILVLEDLDSLLTEESRAFFLNELDGFGQNEGILTIASTNHPERIDDSITQRPSRFDVKYTFDLPTESLRKTFALRWLRKVNALPPERKSSIEFARSENELAEDIAKSTDGWSFAFMKELFMSFMLNIAHNQSSSANRTFVDKPMAFSDDLLLSKVSLLAAQVKKAKEEQKKAATVQQKPPGVSIPPGYIVAGNLGIGQAEVGPSSNWYLAHFQPLQAPAAAVGNGFIPEACACCTKKAMEEPAPSPDTGSTSVLSKFFGLFNGLVEFLSG